MKKAKAYITRKTIACVPMAACDDHEEEESGFSDNEKDNNEAEVINFNNELNQSY